MINTYQEKNFYYVYCNNEHLENKKSKILFSYAWEPLW